ncbi:MAG: DUF1844 domain-containing protein [bacterium]|nr:DUF1844 domain-containing protein [bacterium]
MEQEKAQDFKVTDKRAAFREESTESHQEEALPEDKTEDRQTQEQTSHSPLSEVDFMTLIFSLYTHAQISLGIIPDPMSGQTMKEPVQAKYNIDLLGILKEKTQGNLSREEEQALEQMLYELRMNYVQAR